MPRLRPIRTKEEAKNVPLDQDLMIELEPEGTVTIESEENPEIQVGETDAQREAKRLAAKEYRQNKKQEDEARESETNDLKQQLEDMRRAAEEQKRQIVESQKAQQEAARIAKEREQEVSRYASRAEGAEYEAVLTALSAAEAEADSGQRDLENALNNADNKAAVDAQRRIARAEARLVQLQDGKDALETKRAEAVERAKNAPQEQSQRNNLTLEQSIDAQPTLTQSQKDWLKAHPDAWTDQRKNLRLQGAHVEAEDLGYAPGSKKYFAYLEDRLGYKPDDPDDEEPEDQPRRKIVSAPVSRDNISTRSGRPSKSTITLTVKQREAAAIAGVDEITYARQMVKLDGLKQEGYYNEG